MDALGSVLIIELLTYRHLSLSSLHRIQHLVILRYRSNGCHGCVIGQPAQRKDHDRESDLPFARRIGTPPDQRQSQRSHAKERDNDVGLPEIPGDRFLSMGRTCGRIEELAAVLALYRRILDLFGTIRAFFHKHFLGNAALSTEWLNR